MILLELQEIDVDGCGTDINCFIGVNDFLTEGEKERIKEAVNAFKEETDEWSSDDLFEIVVEQLQKDGYKVTFFDRMSINF